MWFRDTHPTDHELILAADGELPARRVERLRRHLAGCWECRVRTQELEGAIGEFVHLHRGSLDPLLPPASGRRALLKAQLDELAAAQPLPSARLLVSRRRLIPLAASAAALVIASLIVPFRWTVRREQAIY